MDVKPITAPPHFLAVLTKCGLFLSVIIAIEKSHSNRMRHSSPVLRITARAWQMDVQWRRLVKPFAQVYQVHIWTFQILDPSPSGPNAWAHALHFWNWKEFWRPLNPVFLENNGFICIPSRSSSWSNYFEKEDSLYVLLRSHHSQ